MGRVYKELGKRNHEDPSEDLDQAAVRSSLGAAGLDPSIVDRALYDDHTMEDVRAEHEAAVSEVGAFGVPTIVFRPARGFSVRL
ncbi:MAG: hypothetical protein H0U16_09790 [Actinobacteria bacterium]|nr:hypothetical protein [Actinomycetota bacterium]